MRGWCKLYNLQRWFSVFFHNLLDVFSIECLINTKLFCFVMERTRFIFLVSSKLHILHFFLSITTYHKQIQLSEHLCLPQRLGDAAQRVRQGRGLRALGQRAGGRHPGRGRNLLSLHDAIHHDWQVQRQGSGASDVRCHSSPGLLFFCHAV